MNFEITEINRLIANLIRIGTIAEVDDSKALARVTIGNLKTDWLPWATQRAGNDRTWWRPDLGEQVIVISPSGDTSQAVIFLSFYGQGDQPSQNPDEQVTQYQYGTKVSYNRKTSTLTIDCVGHVQINSHSTNMITVTTHDGNVTINGDLSVNGNTTTSGNAAVSGSLSAKGGISGIGGLSFEGHVHTDGDGETTGTPR